MGKKVSRKHLTDACLNCKSGSFQTINKIKGRKIVICKRCQLVSVKPIPSEEEITKIIDNISENFFAEYEEELDSYVDYFNDKMSDIISFKNKGKLLDIGCGSGIFLEIAQSKDWDTVGIDKSTEAIRICHSKSLNAMNKSLDQLIKRLTRFDIITAFQVIEHTTRPDEFLKQIYKLLKPEGYLIITTPNQRGFLARIMGKYWFEYYNMEHFYFFPPKTLKDMIIAAGFKVQSCRTEFGRRIDLEYIWNRLLKYYYLPDTGFHKVLKVMGVIPRIFNKVITIREPFVNIYLIAKK